MIENVCFYSGKMITGPSSPLRDKIPMYLPRALYFLAPKYSDTSSFLYHLLTRFLFIESFIRIKHIHAITFLVSVILAIIFLLISLRSRTKLPCQRSIGWYQKLWIQLWSKFYFLPSGFKRSLEKSYISVITVGDNCTLITVDWERKDLNPVKTRRKSIPCSPKK